MVLAHSEMDFFQCQPRGIQLFNDRDEEDGHSRCDMFSVMGVNL